MNRSTFPAFIVLALALASASGCMSGKWPRDDHFFHGYLEDELKSWDPAHADDEISLAVVPEVYETLFQYSYLSDHYELQPLLAAEMPKRPADRLTWIFTIKPGVRFQNDPCFKATGGEGREVHAEDFVVAFRRLALPSVASEGWRLFENRIIGLDEFRAKHPVAASKGAKADRKALLAALQQPIAGVRSLGTHRLEIRLKRPFPQLLNALALTFTAPVPIEAVAAYADESGNLPDHPVGSGPFVLKRWDRGNIIRLERNPTHHPEFYPIEGSEELRRMGFMADAGKLLPLADGLEYESGGETRPAWAPFLRGQLDAIRLPRDRFAQAITNVSNLSPELSGRGVRLSIEGGLSFTFLLFNPRDPLLGTGPKAALLRQAISSAIDRRPWIDLSTAGTANEMTSAAPPGLPDEVKREHLEFGFDLKRAKALLKKAGYPDGKGLPELTLDLRGADAVNYQLGQLLVAQLHEIGIQLKPSTHTLSGYLQKQRRGEFQIGYGVWGMDYPDIEEIYHLPMVEGWDLGPEYRALYEKMSAMIPGPARAALIAELDHRLQQTAPWIIGFAFSRYELSQPWVLNLRSNELSSRLRGKYVRINEVVKRRYLEHRD